MKFRAAARIRRATTAWVSQSFGTPRRPLRRAVSALWGCVLAGWLASWGGRADAGVAVRWDRCLGEGGVADKAFDCRTDIGEDSLVVSVVSDMTLDALTGFEIVMDIESSSPTLPDWWRFRNANCRSTAMTFVPRPSSPGEGCLDVWEGAAVGGVANFFAQFNGTPSSARLLAVVAGPVRSLPVGTEALVCGLRLGRMRTSQPDSCAGCSVPMCIGIASVKCTQSAGVGDYHASGPFPGTTSHFMTWQGARVSAYHQHPRWRTYDQLVCANASAVRQSTWGQVKAMFR